MTYIHNSSQSQLFKDFGTIRYNLINIFAAFQCILNSCIPVTIRVISSTIEQKRVQIHRVQPISIEISVH